MANRLTRIYTGTGDDGTTGLADGHRVAKEGARIQAIGEVDELNCQLGVALATELVASVATPLGEVQQVLFDLGGELALPGRSHLDAHHVTALERVIDQLNAPLPPLTNFILPGGHPSAAALHLARAICRRTERAVTTLARQEAVNPHTCRYLNRLSDLLFVAARTQNLARGVAEVLWQPGDLRPRG